MILSPNERLITISLHKSPRFACQIAEDLRKQDTVIAHNLKKMLAVKLVKYERLGVQKKFRLTGYGDSIYELLLAHDTSFRELVTNYQNMRRE